MIVAGRLGSSTVPVQLQILYYSDEVDAMMRECDDDALDESSVFRVVIVRVARAACRRLVDYGAQISGGNIGVQRPKSVQRPARAQDAGRCTA
jgi:hypothetical protein